MMDLCIGERAGSRGEKLFSNQAFPFELFDEFALVVIFLPALVSCSMNTIPSGFSTNARCVSYQIIPQTLILK